MLPLRSVGRSNFDKGRHNLTTLIQKRHILMRTAVLCNGINSGQLCRKNKTLYIYIYIYIYIVFYTLFVTFKKVYDRNVVNKYGLYSLLCAIIYNLVDYIYIYVCIIKLLKNMAYEPKTSPPSINELKGFESDLISLI